MLTFEEKNNKSIRNKLQWNENNAYHDIVCRLIDWLIDWLFY